MTTAPPRDQNPPGPIGNAIAKREEGPAALITQYRADFATVLPAHFKPETFVRLAQGVLRRDQKLAQAAAASPGSLLVALLDCSRLGHEPGTDEFYLVPRGNKVQGIEGYKGIIKRMFNSGTVDSIVAEAVYANDVFHWEPGTMGHPEHRAEWFGDRGECVGAYAYAVFKSGGVSKVAIVGEKRIQRAMKASESSKSDYSPWKTDYDKMVIKTALHDLEPYVPKSAEAITHDAEARTAVEQIRTEHELPPLDGDEYVDLETGEVVN